MLPAPHGRRAASPIGNRSLSTGVFPEGQASRSVPLLMPGNAVACRMRFDAVFFDLYGTLLIYGDMSAAWSAWLSALHGWLDELGLAIDRDKLARRCEGFFGWPAPSLANDGLTVYERRLRDLATDLRTETDRARLQEGAKKTIGAWQAFVTLDPEAPPVLEKLSANHALALVSNFDHPPHVTDLLRQTGLDQHLPVVVVSGAVGIKKPDPGIFAPAIEAVGITPRRIAHVGDAPEDILAAHGAGMTPVRLQRDDDTEGDRAADFRHSPVPRAWTAGIDHPTVSSLRELPGLFTKG